MKVQIREVQFGVGGAFLVGARSLKGDGGVFFGGCPLVRGGAVVDASSLSNGDVKINNVVLFV